MAKVITEETKRQLELIKKNQEIFRNDPQKLAAAIAHEIRTDQLLQEKIKLEGRHEVYLDVDDDEVKEDGRMHWQQNSWAEVSPDSTPIELFEEGEIQGYTDDKLLTVQCGTTACIAGHATTLAGFALVVGSVYYGETIKDAVDRFFDRYTFGASKCYDRKERKEFGIETKAMELLNLSSRHASWLFEGCRTVDQVLWALDEIAENGIFDLDRGFQMSGDVEEDYEDDE